REIACLQQLNHPHIIRMWSHGRWPDPRRGLSYIVMDFVDGYTLAQWVQKSAFTPHEAAVVFLKLFDAAHCMHERQVFHRDLSMNNILVTRQGEPVIIDFGVADYATADTLTDGPLPPGTPRNRSPEAQEFWEKNRHNPQARYRFQATDDLFALGVNLYDVLTDPTPTRPKRRPLLGNPLLPPPSPHKVSGGRVPLEFSSYVMLLIDPSLEVRPGSALHAKRAHEEFARQEGEAWHGHTVHSVTAQLPPPPPEGAVAMAPPAPGPAAPSASRPPPGWRQPALLAPLLPVVLAAVVAALLPRPPAAPRAPPALAEKPTSHPVALPLPLPTQQEASPSVKPQDTSPTHTQATPSPPLPQASKPRGLSKAQRCALLVFTLEWGAASCAGVQKRPEPGGACPEEALRAMRQELGWAVDSNQSALIQVDVTKPPDEWTQNDDNTVYADGPVTGAVVRNPEGKAPIGTRLEGHLWTTGDRIYGRYIRAILPDGRTLPICLELEEDEDNVGIPKFAGSKPGQAVGWKTSQTRNVERWR
ncbi:MAG TPA: protein kinase, partial [Myxococcaceae bacterium]